MGMDRALALERRLGWTDEIRPMILGSFFADLLAPDRRTILQNQTGLKYYADPLSMFGHALIQGGFENETEQILRAHLRAGDAFLDVGANEGYFSVMGGSIVGPGGYVASVEPQSRLTEIIEINMGLNGVKGRIFPGALGGPKGEQATIHLWPSLNTGSSGLTSKPRFSSRAEKVNFVDPEELLNGRGAFALAKVDVEGFEDRVILSLLPLLQRGQIRVLILDYHESLLAAKGVDPVGIERMVVKSGMVLDGTPESYSGYRVYVKS
jgi:FkbM family methyltransferase